MNYFPSVRVNLRGREPDGQVAPADYDRFVADLCDELEAWECVERAWRRDELYDGGYVDRAPDVVLQLALEDGYSHSCLRSRGGAPFRRIGPDEFMGGRERGMNGNHRPQGVLFLSEETGAVSAGIEDVAPTVLACLGLAGPPMDGTALLGKPNGAAHAAKRAPECDYTREQQQAVEDRLRDLGYFE
ncbi:MAG: hypothetical protein GWP08_19305 [Nitrospiraceae bacterium]|nr:hypothetical protein [Nitrospiraceae bacterium]